MLASYVIGHSDMVCTESHDEDFIKKEKRNCCGCTACYNACPRKAITMIPDNEGFLYPEICQDKCIKCGLCNNVCPILHRVQHEERTEGFIIRYKNDKIVEESTSGGVFTALATHLMDKGYVVYGAGYDDNMQVICKMATNTEELKEMRGSKFVQSTLGATFQTIKTQLKDGQKILFTGTPCQVSGLISYLGKKPEKLICIDFVCRGVPSPGLWKNYVDMMEKKYGSKIVGARFKNKTYGYHGTTMKVDFANGKAWYGSGRVDPMMKAFVTEMASRPSCHACAFKGVKRQSDITMFDCYEFSQITGRRDDDKGYSSILIHTEQGKELLNSVKNMLICYEIPIDKLVSKNGVMVRNSAKPNEKREYFYKCAAKESIDIAMQKTAPITKKDYILESIKIIFYKTGLNRIVWKLKKEKLEIISREEE